METLLNIPFEATEVRAAAKSLGARWRPTTKQWALPTDEAADTIRAAIKVFEAASPIHVHKMHEDDYNRGEIIREDGAWLFVERTERWWCDPDDGMCRGDLDRGYHYELYCRLATEDESAEQEGYRVAEDRARGALRAAGTATDVVRASDFESEMRPPAEGSERIVEKHTVYGFGEWWHIEPAGTPGRRIIHTSYRGADGDGWHAGNYGSQNCTGHAVPWTPELEKILRTAKPHWDAR